MRCFALVPALMLPCCLQVEVDTNDVCTVSSCAVAVQACSDPPQTVSGHVPELDLPAASVHSITTLKYSPFHPAASPDITSTCGSSMTGSAAALNRGGEAEQVVLHLSCSSEGATTSHAPAGIRPDMHPCVSAATDQQELSGSTLHGRNDPSAGTGGVCVVQGNAAQRLSATAELQQPIATDDADGLTDTDEILPVKVMLLLYVT